MYWMGNEVGTLMDCCLCFGRGSVGDLRFAHILVGWRASLIESYAGPDQELLCEIGAPKQHQRFV